MLLKKYFILLLFLSLSLLYNIFTDVMIGQPWDNFMRNMNYALVTSIEKATLWSLVLFIVIPDISRNFRKKTHKK